MEFQLKVFMKIVLSFISVLNYNFGIVWKVSGVEVLITLKALKELTLQNQNSVVPTYTKFLVMLNFR